MIRTNRVHRSYCYLCKTSMHTCTGMLQLRYKSGWANTRSLCTSCTSWVMAVMELARYKVDWQAPDGD